ncbi:MAG: OsmC family protein [Flavitalea sp.]
MVRIELSRVNGDFGFEAKDSNGHTVRMDTSPETGGTNFGVRPMQMMLMGLGGCSGIDIVSILKKQRQDLKDFKTFIEGEREAGKEPSLWENVTIVFELTGNLDPEKAERACALSMDKYCSVAETLRKAGCNLTWKCVLKPVVD